MAANGAWSGASSAANYQKTSCAWVDATGRVLPPPPPSFPYPPPHIPAASAPPMPLPPAGGDLPPAAAEWAALAPEERTMRLWRRVSPGMTPGAGGAPPKSTAHELHAPPAALGGIEPIDATHHLRRTDFADYVEARARLRAAAKRAAA